MHSTFDLDELAGQAVEDCPSRAPQRPAEREGDAVELLDDAESMRIMDALRFVPAHDRPTWLRVGCALHHATAGSEHGYSVWSRWSLTSPTVFDPAEQRSTWQHLRAEHPKPVTLASIYALAQERGWRPRDDEPLEPTAGVLRRHWARIEPSYLDVDPARQAWLVERPDGEGLLPSGRVALLTAAGGAGKSMALLGLAVSICARRPWLGHFVVGSVAPRVAILAGEDDALTVHRRVRRIVQALKLSEGELESVRRGLYVLPLAGEVASLVATEGERVVPTGEMRDLLALLDDGEPWGAIILDPLARFASAEVESRNDYATALVQHVERLTKAQGEPAVIVACHSSKVARRAGAADVRGVTGLHDAARSVVELVAEGAEVVRLRLAKSNLGPPCEDVFLRRREHGVLAIETETEARARTSSTATTDPQADRAATRAKERQSLADAARARALDIAGRTRGLALRELADRVGGSDAIARRAISRAVEDGELVVIREGSAQRHYLPDDVPARPERGDDDAGRAGTIEHASAERPDERECVALPPSTPLPAGRAAAGARPRGPIAARVDRAGPLGPRGPLDLGERVGKSALLRERAQADIENGFEERDA